MVQSKNQWVFPFFVQSTSFEKRRTLFHLLFSILFFLGLALTNVSCQSVPQSSSNFEIGKNYTGFKLERMDWLPDFKSNAFYFAHEKSGAQLIFIANKDSNKTFSISFKTPPYDNTGVFHIFEHSVLAGSKRYPSKSLFFSIDASSLASFLNAMTYPLFTTYPFSSKVKKDFFNLLNAYLDAVFYPNVLKNPNIIKREGFRIEWNKKLKKFQYNGIVFSEMKGVFTNPYFHLYRNTIKSLLSETPYAFESGGNPENIVQLKFHQIKEAHTKYYHPDNSLIYLYGDLDIKKALSTIHENFLKNFNKRKNFKLPEVKTQETFKPRSIVKSSYPVVDSKDLKEKTFISLNYVLGKGLPLEDKASLHILGTALFNEENSPGKKLTKSLRLARDIEFDDDWGTQENIASIILKGVSSIKNQNKIKRLVEKILKDTARKGLSPKLIESILNQREFSLREVLFNSPNKGLDLSLNYITPHWIHQDYDLKTLLEFNKRFSILRKKLKNQNYIKELIKKHFVKNKKKNLLLLSPNPHLIKKLNQKLSQKLKKIIQKEDLKKIKKEDQEFKNWQVALESKEIDQKTPRLDPSTLSPQIEKIKFKKRFYENQSIQKTHFEPLEIYSFPQNTGGINYIDLHFDLSHIPEENLYDLALILYLIQKVNTTKRNFSELTHALNNNLGNLSFGVETFAPLMNKKESKKLKKQRPSSDLKHFHPHLIVSAKFLNEKNALSFDLIQEVLTQSLFEPKNQVKSLILELINQKKASATKNARYLASLSGKAFFLDSAKWMTYVDGHMSEIYLRKLEKDILKNPSGLQKLIKKLTHTLSLLITQNNLRLVLLVGEKENLEHLRLLSEKLISKLNLLSKKDFNASRNLKKASFFKNYKAVDGFEIPSQVQYNHMMIPYFKLKKRFNGKLVVFARTLTFEYLFKVLREQNGAYGTRSTINSEGIFHLSSYRDPKLKNTFKTFEAMTHFFDTFPFTQKKLDSLIVGSLKPYYKPKSPYNKVRAFMDRKLIHMSEKDYQRIKKEILSTKIKDIKKINEDLKKLLQKAKKTTAGGREKIAKEAPFVKEKLAL